MKPWIVGRDGSMLYPFEPAITTWNWSRYWPSLVAVAFETGVPQKTHLMLVTEAGLGHACALGSREGSRSK